ncbi:MAG: hypothetical protein HYT28_01905 [Parcubacteria group bacterium]|nr:hypothetical protein [Parcubacteria group bacterium]
MSIQEIFSALAGIFCAIGYVFYITDIMRGNTIPAKATWLIWACLDSIALVGMYIKDAVNGLILVASVCAWLVSALSLKCGKSGWTNIDLCSIGGAVIGVVLWSTFNNPTIGIATSLAAIFIGSIPTFASALEDPSRENKTAWIIFLFRVHARSRRFRDGHLTRRLNQSCFSS